MSNLVIKQKIEKKESRRMENEVHVTVNDVNVNVHTSAKISNKINRSFPEENVLQFDNIRMIDTFQDRYFCVQFP